MMLPQLWHVDAFSERPFGGNPAAVCVLPDPGAGAGEWPGVDWMQGIAAEMNLSETAFLARRDEGVWGLRWFTPAVEVDLCGHATLAAAHVLWAQGAAVSNQAVQFATRSGMLRCARVGALIGMRFPRWNAAPAEAIASKRVTDALGAKGRPVFRSGPYWLVEMANADAVRRVSPDLAALAALDPVMCTARDDGEAFDFVSRFFAPGAGIPEDPVTGSAHCALGPFWAERLGRTELSGWQASARGGRVDVLVKPECVMMRGQAVTVARGEVAAIPTGWLPECPEQPVLETGRLTLRPLELGDAASVQRLAGDPGVAATTARIPHPYEDGMAEQWIAEVNASFVRWREVAFGMVLRQTGELVGAAGLHRVSDDTAELGYWVGRPYWNRGIATEAARRVVRWGFEEWRLRRIESHHFVENPASGRVLSKVGLQREGTLRRAFVKDGRARDLHAYGLLADEFKPSEA